MGFQISAIHTSQTLKIIQNNPEIIESELAKIVKYVVNNNKHLTIYEHEQFYSFFEKTIDIIKNIN